MGAVAVLLVGAGGAVGAVARYLVGRRLRSLPPAYATLVVNVAGSFLLGLVAFGGVADRLALLAGVGFCGAFTTFSSFAVETVDLWAERPAYALANALGTLLLAAGAAGLAALLV